MAENLNLLWVFIAGLTSVFSPCVLPILPILVAGTEQEDRTRPLLIVVGLTTMFVLMGLVTSLLGGALVGHSLYYVEKSVGALIIIFGVLMLFDINLFKHMSWLTNIRSSSQGKLGGLVLGLTLGLIWIPCVGPMLASVLALVAAKGTMGYGAWLLLVYSLGFSIPILIAAYAAHFFRNQVGFFKRHPIVIRWVSGILLIVFGTFIIFKGMMAFGAL